MNRKVNFFPILSLVKESTLTIQVVEIRVGSIRRHELEACLCLLDEHLRRECWCYHHRAECWGPGMLDPTAGLLCCHLEPYRNSPDSS